MPTSIRNDEKPGSPSMSETVHRGWRNVFGELWRPLLMLTAVTGVVILARVLGWGERVGELRQWIQSLGAWGPVAFVGIYVLATVAALPGVLISVFAGVVFGSVLGVLLVSIGSTIGAGLAFLIARYFARQSVVRWMARNEKFQRLDEMTGRHGAIVVAFVRLIPLFPFDIVNYGFGLTGIPFATYIFWSWLCMLPGTVLYVVGADAVARVITSGGIPWAYVAVAAAMVVLLMFLVRYAYRIIKPRDEESGGRK